MTGRHIDHDTVALPREAVDRDRAMDPDIHADLATDPFDDDLAVQLQARVSRKQTPRTTLALAGLVVLVGGFLGGIIVQKNFGAAAASAAGPGGAGGVGGFGGVGGPGASAGPGQATGNQAGRNATTGTVKLVDGGTIYVTTANGDIITVKTSSSTAVRSQESIALTDIPVGATITVQGAADTDGIITATQVTAQK